MQLKISKDATGKTEYKLFDTEGNYKISSKSLVKYRIANGDVSNAYIDNNGEIVLIADNKGTLIKNDKRIQMEIKIADMIGSSKYDIIAIIKDDDGRVSGYKLQDLKGAITSLKVSTAILYASVGAIRNAKVEYDGTKEYIVGNGIDLNNLACIGGKKADNKASSSVKMADGVVNVEWEDVKHTKRSLEDKENTDARSALLEGMRYPKTSYLGMCTMNIIVDNIECRVTVENIEQIIKDETDTLIIKVRYNARDIKVMCHGTNYVELNSYVVALAAFEGIKVLDRKVTLSEVNMLATDGRMWRLFFKEGCSGNEEDNSIKIENDTIRNLTAMYDIEVCDISSKVSVEEQRRLITGLKIGKAAMRIVGAKEYYDIIELFIETGDIKRINIRIKGSTGEELNCYYQGLRQENVNIKNIILICAASVSKLCEIRSVSIKALNRDSEFLVSFKSKIR